MCSLEAVDRGSVPNPAICGACPSAARSKDRSRQCRSEYQSPYPKKSNGGLLPAARPMAKANRGSSVITIATTPHSSSLECHGFARVRYQTVSLTPTQLFPIGLTICFHIIFISEQIGIRHEQRACPCCLPLTSTASASQLDFSRLNGWPAFSCRRFTHDVATIDARHGADVVR